MLLPVEDRKKPGIMSTAGDSGIGLKGWIAGRKPRAKFQEAKLEPVILDKQRIAVLPFTNMSPSRRDEYFSDGLTEELITKLSEMGDLKVIARTSVMSFKRKERKVSEIGSELGVGSVIEGSVRKAGNKIRVTVQLVDSRTEEHLWACTYDRELDDVFAIQSDVASKVASALSTGVFSLKPRRDTKDTEAYTLYLRAMQLYHEGSEQSLKEAVKLFESATSRDPLFARAYAGLAEAWNLIGGAMVEDFTFSLGKAEDAARKALEAGPDCAEAHAAMSSVHRALDRFPQAVSEAENALRINPNLSEAYLSLGILHNALGTLEQALGDFERAYELDPLSFYAGSLVARALMEAARYSEALNLMERMKELNPKNPRVYDHMAECYMIQGDFSSAERMLDAAQQFGSTPALLGYRGLLYALAGRRREAEEQLQLILKMDSESYRITGQLYIQAALGNLDAAFKALKRMAENHSWPADIKTSPFFKDLRMDPRYAEFCKRVGLPT